MHRPGVGIHASQQNQESVGTENIMASLIERIRQRIAEPLPSTLKNRLDVQLGHSLADLPMEEVPAVTVEDVAEREELFADIDVSNLDVPVLMRLQRLR